MQLNAEQLRLSMNTHVTTANSYANVFSQLNVKSSHALQRIYTHHYHTNVNMSSPSSMSRAVTLCSNTYMHPYYTPVSVSSLSSTSRAATLCSNTHIHASLLQTCVDVFSQVNVKARPDSSTGAHFGLSYILNAQSLGLDKVE